MEFAKNFDHFSDKGSFDLFQGKEVFVITKQTLVCHTIEEGELRSEIGVRIVVKKIDLKKLVGEAGEKKLQKYIDEHRFVVRENEEIRLAPGMMKKIELGDKIKGDGRVKVAIRHDKTDSKGKKEKQQFGSEVEFKVGSELTQQELTLLAETIRLALNQIKATSSDSNELKTSLTSLFKPLRRMYSQRTQQEEKNTILFVFAQQTGKIIESAWKKFHDTEAKESELRHEKAMKDDMIADEKLREVIKQSLKKAAILLDSLSDDLLDADQKQQTISNLEVELGTVFDFLEKG